MKIAILIDYMEEVDKLDNRSKQIYTIFKNALKERGIEVVRVSYFHYDQQRQLFTNYVDEINGEFQIIYKEYKPDILRKRVGSGNFYCEELFNEFILIPSLKIMTICNDKFETYLALQEFQPKTVLMERFFRDSTVIDKMNDILVVKPIRSNSGKGIQKYKKIDLINNRGNYQGLERLYIVQEFKDFSKGYPGISNGIHDLRFVFMGGKYIYSTLRMPNEKSEFRANVGIGGTELFIQSSNIPKDLFELVNSISEKLNTTNKDIYSLDLSYCMDDKKWYLLEVNYSPGFPDEPALEVHINGLVDYFTINFTNHEKSRNTYRLQ